MDNATVGYTGSTNHAYTHHSHSSGQQSGMSIQELIKYLEQRYGADCASNACHNEQLSGLLKSLKDYVNEQNCPQAIKDDCHLVLDDAATNCSMPCSPEAQADVQECGLAGSCQDLGQSIAEEATGGSASATGDHAGGANEGGSAPVPENNLNQLGSAGEKEGEGGNENWLVAMAKGLARVQSKFLTAAMDNLKVMEANAGAVAKTAQTPNEQTAQATEGAQSGQGSGGGSSSKSGSSNTETSGSDTQKPKSEVSAEDRKEAEQRDAFLQAQAMFQANMQMFNLIVNMTATTLKTVGEGMASLARKQ